MSLSDGDPADGGDIWFRIVTQENHLVRGRVHHSAFGGNAIAPPQKGKNRPWDRELSGRLRTLAGTLEEITNHAEAYCEALTAKGQGKKTFSGVMYVRVRDAKKTLENILTTAIHYTPLDEDKAHADLTFNGWIRDTKEDRERFNLWFSGMLQALHHPGQLQYLPEASGFAKLFHRLRSLARRALHTVQSRPAL
jgi:hypothetical protein